MNDELQLAIIGKCFFSREVFEKLKEAVSFGKITFNKEFEPLFLTIAQEFKNNGGCDVFTAIEMLHQKGIKDSVDLVRRANDASKNICETDVLLEIKNILSESDKSLVFSDTERLKLLNNEILKVAAECLVNKHIKKITTGSDVESYIVRLKGGLSVYFKNNGQVPIIYLSAGSVNRFPISYKFIDDLYNELNNDKEDTLETPETNDAEEKPIENDKETIEYSPAEKSKKYNCFLANFLK